MVYFPHKKYSVVYADPPWSYQDKCRRGGGAENHYSCMSIDDICRLPVRSICEDDSVLFMWTTFPQLELAFSVVSSWGFVYKTCAFTWVKTNKDDSLFMRMGRYTRANAEICLIGKRGNGLKRLSGSVRNTHLCKRLRHSEKPVLFRELIVELFGDVSRIELFARTKAEGWDVWGNEVGKFSSN